MKNFLIHLFTTLLLMVGLFCLCFYLKTEDSPWWMDLINVVVSSLLITIPAHLKIQEFLKQNL